MKAEKLFPLIAEQHHVNTTRKTNANPLCCTTIHGMADMGRFGGATEAKAFLKALNLYETTCA